MITRRMSLGSQKQGLLERLCRRTTLPFSCQHLSISLIAGQVRIALNRTRYALPFEYYLLCFRFIILLHNIYFRFDWAFEVRHALLHESSAFLGSRTQKIKLICHRIASPILQINVIEPSRLRRLLISKLLLKLLQDTFRSSGRLHSFESTFPRFAGLKTLIITGLLKNRIQLPLVDNSIRI